MKSRGCLVGLIIIAVIAIGVVMWGMGVYNSLVGLDESVRSAWSQVESQYQRRSDLIPNLVNTVKGYAQQEKDVLLGVTEARAKVGTIQATPELVDNPE